MVCIAVYLTEGIKALLEDYKSGSKERRRLLDRRYGSAILASLEDNLNEMWKIDNTQPCPHCYIPIEVVYYINKIITIIFVLF